MKLLLAVFMLAGMNSFASAEDRVSYEETITKGFLILHGESVAAPFHVKVVGATATINGIQIYPHVISQRDTEVNEIFMPMKELYYSDVKRIKETEAFDVFLKKLNKGPQISNTTVKVDWCGKKSVEILFRNGKSRTLSQCSLPPERFKKTAEIRGKLEKQFLAWKRQHGKERAFELLGQALQKEPLIEKHALHPDSDSCDVKWKDSDSFEGWGLGSVNVSGEARNLTADEFWAQRSAKYLALWLSQDHFVIRGYGNFIVTSPNGRTAYERTLSIVREKLPKDSAIKQLKKDFQENEVESAWSFLER